VNVTKGGSAFIPTLNGGDFPLRPLHPHKLNTDLHLGVPGSDEDILENLVQHGVFGSGMRQSLKAMKGFRNIVVHRYGAIDDALAFSILKEHIGDFALFRQEVERFLQSPEAQGSA